jgi:hypothetical protein
MDDIARGLSVAYGVVFEARHGENPDVAPTDEDLELALTAISRGLRLFEALSRIPTPTPRWRRWIDRSRSRSTR